MPKAVGSGWAMPLHEFKTGVTTYTVRADQCGTLFLNTGENGNIIVTLPKCAPEMNGWWAEFATTSANKITLTSDPTDSLICHADLAADTFATAATIGQHMKVVGTSWDEVQTLTLTGGGEGDHFKLSWGGVKTAFITCPAGGYANLTALDIANALYTHTAIFNGDIAVSKPAGETYRIVFVGARKGADQTAITVTDTNGAAAGSVAETVKGGSQFFVISNPSLADGATSGLSPIVIVS